MVIAEYAVICNGCGAHGPGSHRRASDAQHSAQAEGWTTNTVTEHVGALHWCPACTAARKEPR